MIYSHSYIHRLMVAAAMQAADQHIRNSLAFSILPKDTSTCRPWESNQQPSDNKTLALPLRQSWQSYPLSTVRCPPLKSIGWNIDWSLFMDTQLGTGESGLCWSILIEAQINRSNPHQNIQECEPTTSRWTSWIISYHIVSLLAFTNSL